MTSVRRAAGRAWCLQAEACIEGQKVHRVAPPGSWVATA